MRPFKVLLVLLAPGVLAGCMGNPFSLVSGHLTTVSATSVDPIKGAVSAMSITTRDKKNQKPYFTGLTINLDRAPPFIFVFPDGTQVNSREITEAVLEDHLGPPKAALGVMETRYLARKRSPFNPLEPFARTRPVNYEIAFYTKAADGIRLSIHTCNYTLPKIIGTADGAQLFDMPIDQEGLNKVFGIQTKLVSEDVLLDRFYLCGPE